MKEAVLPSELLILADSPVALTDLCGISLLERLRRIALGIGFRAATILSKSVDSIAAHLACSSWRRGDISLKFLEHKGPEITVGDVHDCAGAARTLIVCANFYYDERLLRALAEAQTDAVLIDSDPPATTTRFWQDAHANPRLPWAALVSSKWFSAKNRVSAFMQEIASDMTRNRVIIVDAAQQPAYVRSMRRNLRPVFFPAPSPEVRPLAERLLIDSTQKGALDFPALVHAPIEKWLVSRLCRTSITPNQVTLGTAFIGLNVTLLYAFGYLWIGVLLALTVGILDGIDGKLARLKAQTTKLGKREHDLDHFVETSWWTALAYHFHAGGEVRYAYALLIAFIAADFFDRIARRSVEPKLDRSLDDVSRFDRLVRCVAGRRNIYTWLFAFFLLLGAPATGFVLLCCWGITSNVLHIIRASQIRARGWR